MKTKKSLITVKTALLVIVFGSVMLIGYGRPRHPGRRADRNRDGRVDRHEHKMARDKAKVNTRWEAKADKNKDGIVGPKEAAKANKDYKKKQSQVDTAWEDKADKNDDGTVSRKEAKAFWHHKKVKVNTAIEKKYDKNKDGIIDPKEAYKILKDKSLLIKSKGKAKVDTAIEKKYDKNKDGIIDKKEVEKINKELQNYANQSSSSSS